VTDAYPVYYPAVFAAGQGSVTQGTQYM
jgi:hypothetical protein